jgi:F-type H+-transporting ATPase subunit gamma
VNTLTQVPRTRQVLPIANFEVADVLSSADKQIPAPVEAGSTEYLFEPSAHDVLNAVLPHYVHFEVFQMVLDSRASEHSARMVAMKNATDNAKQLIKDLTLEYNKIRQASITTEILEIATAQSALG